MAESKWINSATGDYVITDGAIQNINALVTRLYTRLACPIGQWMYDTTFGSDVPNAKNKKAIDWPMQRILNDIKQVMDVELQAQNLRSYTVSPQLPLDAFSYRFSVNGVDNNGEPIKFNFSL